MFYPVVGSDSELRVFKIPYEKWGAVWSCLEFPNHPMDRFNMFQSSLQPGPVANSEAVVVATGTKRPTMVLASRPVAGFVQGNLLRALDDSRDVGLI